MKKLSVWPILVLLLLTKQGHSQSDILIASGGTWKYWANTQANAPAAGWKGGVAFDDTGWPSGAAKLGFGGDGETTVIPAGCNITANPNCSPKYTTTYFRKTVNIPNVNTYVGYLAELVRDDGAVIYVNGQEVWRTNMPAGPVSYTSFASVATAGTAENQVMTSPVIPVSYFQNGTNLIAVEVHQINSTSSDLGMDFQLKGLYSIPVNETIYFWSGAITTSSARVNAKLTSPTTQARLVVSTNPSLTSPVFGAFVTADETHNMMAALSIAGLSPNTTYYYAIQADGVTDNSSDDIGSFKTFGTTNYSFKFTAGSCALSSNHPVYNRMADKNPNLFIMLGDFHYDNPNSGSDINVHRAPYENNMLSQPASKAFFKNVPFAYIWDDHDFSGNDSDSTAAGKSNARLAYREYVPHYPLATGNGDNPIYHSFTVGRVHFILTDLRSTRFEGSVIMNTIQKQWFKNECLWAKNNNLTIAWINTTSFGGDQVDNWGGYASERTELSDFFKNNNIQNLFIVSGDAHMLAIDNGANHDFSTGGTNSNKYPVFAVAPLNQSGSYKGGLYNVQSNGIVDLTPAANYVYLPANNTEGQYGLVQVTDNGVQLCISFTGYRVNSAGVETQLTTYNFCRTIQGPLPITLSHFTAEITANRKVKLNWEVSEQSGCEKYVVEHSTDDIHFINLEEIKCQAANRYDHVHDNPATGANYYRIRMNESNGKITYSPIRKVLLEANFDFRIFPNPVNDNLKFTIDDGVSNVRIKKASYEICDMAGKKKMEGVLLLNAGTNEVKLPAGVLGKGYYILRLTIGESSHTGQFIVL